MRHWVSRNILYKTNDFSMTKAQAILLLIKPISKKKTLYTNALNRKDPAGIVEKMLDKNKAAKMSNVKYITPKSKHITSILLRLKIQSISSRLQLIEFNNSKKREFDRPVDKENNIAYMANIENIPID